MDRLTNLRRATLVDDLGDIVLGCKGPDRVLRAEARKVSTRVVGIPAARCYVQAVMLGDSRILTPAEAREFARLLLAAAGEADRIAA